MSLTLKLKFTARMHRFFSLRMININKDKSDALIDFLYARFEQQNGFNGEEKPFRITPRFVFTALTDFLKVNKEYARELFRVHRRHRTGVDYHPPAYKSEDSEHFRGRLIQVIGLKHKPNYRITSPDGMPLTPVRMQKVKARMASFNVSFSPVVPQNVEGKPRKRATTATASFEQDMAAPAMALWRLQTPQKTGLFSPRIKVVKAAAAATAKEKPVKALKFFVEAEKKATKELFTFKVTKKDILDRVDAKRGITQKKVMGNISAFDVMKAIGVIISEKQNGRNFHWAHRQGWSLNGGQLKGNLDPTTAGSNYDTLFKIEAPIKNLLLKNLVEEVEVNGEVEFDGNTALPYKITYKLSWGNGKSIVVVIDPMSHRVPTVNEHEMAKSFIGINL